MRPHIPVSSPSSSAISRCSGWLGALPSVSQNRGARTSASVANRVSSCLAPTRLLTTFGVSRRCYFSQCPQMLLIVAERHQESQNQGALQKKEWLCSKGPTETET